MLCYVVCLVIDVFCVIAVVMFDLNNPFSPPFVKKLLLLKSKLMSSLCISLLLLILVYSLLDSIVMVDVIGVCVCVCVCFFFLIIAGSQ